MAAAGPSVFLLMVNGQVESAQVSGRGPRGAARVPPGPSLAGESQRVRGFVRGRAIPPPHVRCGNRPGGVERGRGHSRPSPRGVTGRGLHPTRPARVRAQRGPAPSTLRPSGAGWKGGDLLDLMQRWWRLPRSGGGGAGAVSVGRKGMLPSSPQHVLRTVCYFCV